MPGQVCLLGMSHGNHFAFGGIHSQAELTTSRLNVGNGGANCGRISSDDSIIQVEQGEVQRTSSKFLSERVNGRGEQQRPQWIALLHPVSRRYHRSPELES